MEERPPRTSKTPAERKKRIEDLAKRYREGLLTAQNESEVADQLLEKRALTKNHQVPAPQYETTDHPGFGSILFRREGLELHFLGPVAKKGIKGAQEVTDRVTGETHHHAKLSPMIANQVIAFFQAQQKQENKKE